MDAIDVFDHVRPADDRSTPDGLPPGVYRVVGTSDDAITLLRVTDADGRRAHTGEVYTIPRSDLDAFEPTDNPDEDRSLAAVVSSQLDGFAWQLRMVSRAVVARPIPGTVSLVLAAVGLFGDPYLLLPEYADTVLFLFGTLSLFYLGKTTDTR